MNQDDRPTTHAPARGRDRRGGLARTEERTRCGRIITRSLGARVGPTLEQAGKVDSFEPVEEAIAAGVGDRLGSLDDWVGELIDEAGAV